MYSCKVYNKEISLPLSNLVTSFAMQGKNDKDIERGEPPLLEKATDRATEQQELFSDASVVLIDYRDGKWSADSYFHVFPGQQNLVKDWFQLRPSSARLILVEGTSKELISTYNEHLDLNFPQSGSLLHGIPQLGEELLSSLIVARNEFFLSSRLERLAKDRLQVIEELAEALIEPCNSRLSDFFRRHFLPYDLSTFTKDFQEAMTSAHERFHERFPGSRRSMMECITQEIECIIKKEHVTERERIKERERVTEGERILNELIDARNSFFSSYGSENLADDPLQLMRNVLNALTAACSKPLKDIITVFPLKHSKDKLKSKLKDDLDKSLTATRDEFFRSRAVHDQLPLMEELAEELFKARYKRLNEFFHFHSRDSLPHDQPQLMPYNCFFAKWPCQVRQRHDSRVIENLIASGQAHDKEGVSNPSLYHLNHKAYSREPPILRPYHSLEPCLEPPQTSIYDLDRGLKDLKCAVEVCVSFRFKRAGEGLCGN